MKPESKIKKMKPAVPAETLSQLFVDTWIEGNNHSQKFTLAEVLEKARLKVADPDTTTHVMVGTDSHSFGVNYHFVTVLCVYNVGKGGTYFYKSVLEPRKMYAGSQKMRLQDEVTKSLVVAFEIEQTLGIKPQVHIDASPPTSKEFSSAFSENLRGYVLSNGYDAILKPDSFVSNCIADKHTRKRVRGRKKWIEKS